MSTNGVSGEIDVYRKKLGEVNSSTMVIESGDKLILPMPWVHGIDVLDSGNHPSDGMAPLSATFIYSAESNVNDPNPFRDSQIGYFVHCREQNNIWAIAKGGSSSRLTSKGPGAKPWMSCTKMGWDRSCLLKVIFRTKPSYENFLNLHEEHNCQK